MERLTSYRGEIAVVEYDVPKILGQSEAYCEKIAKQEKMEQVVTRLAAYEDTGLDPDEIIKTFESYRESNLDQAGDLYRLSQQIPHWIPVSERMPDPKDMKHISVLVVQKSKITGRPNIMSVARWNGADWVCKGRELARVTHWAYLPQPPKGEKS